MDGNDPNDPFLTKLAQHCLLIYIQGSDAHTEKLIRRFDRAPKPMCYQPEFLGKVWDEYLSKNNVEPDEVDPDDFIRWTYASALAHRQPRYEAMAPWGVTVTAEEVAQVNTPRDFEALIAAALERRG